MDQVHVAGKIKKTPYEKQRSGAPELPVGALSIGIGVSVCACLIGYFFVMRAINLHEVLMFRMFNMVFMLAGIIALFKIYSRAIHEKIDYFTGIRMGVQMTLVAVIPFAIFMGIYLSIDDHFMEIIRQKVILGEYMHPGPVMAAFSVATEGIVSGFLLTFCCMQFFKKG